MLLFPCAIRRDEQMAGRAGIPVQKHTNIALLRADLTYSSFSVCGGFLEVSEFDFSLV